MSGSESKRFAWVGGMIVVAIALVYAQVSGHAFVEFDDSLYVTGNARVQQGLSLQNLYWALVTTDAYIWHPLTWISYLVDFELYGISSAGPWALTNVFWHGATSILLIAALVTLTGRFWPSAFAAALFALHPIQTEAVVWVSGRKEVLAGFFFVATLLAYARYVERRSRKRYAVVMGMMLLCLMSKGSQVALPFLLLVLDFWPLARFGPGESAFAKETIAALVLEKLPLLGLSFATIILQIPMVAGTYSIWITDPSLPVRLQNGIIAYLDTLGRLAWPERLAIAYPTPAQQGLPGAGSFEIFTALFLLSSATLVFVALVRTRGYLVAAWFWFLGMLLPMIGLLPSGLRVMHDRYSYVPMIGIAILISFGAADLIQRFNRPLRVPAAVLGASILLPSLAYVSWTQAAVWRDSHALFDHALAVTERNAIVHYYRGNLFADEGDDERSLGEYELALQIHPHFPEVNNNLGRLYMRAGRSGLALPFFQRAVEARPDWSPALTNLGEALESRGRNEEALELFERAVAVAPLSADARYYLARAHQTRGHRQRAAEGFREALRIDPEHPWAARGLTSLRSNGHDAGP